MAARDVDELDQRALDHRLLVGNEPRLHPPRRLASAAREPFAQAPGMPLSSYTPRDARSEIETRPISSSSSMRRHSGFASAALLDDALQLAEQLAIRVRRAAARALGPRLAHERRERRAIGGGVLGRELGEAVGVVAAARVAPPLERGEVRALGGRAALPARRARRAIGCGSTSRISLPMYCIWRRRPSCAVIVRAAAIASTSRSGRSSCGERARRRARPAPRPGPAGRASARLRARLRRRIGVVLRGRVGGRTVRRMAGFMPAVEGRDERCAAGALCYDSRPTLDVLREQGAAAPATGAASAGRQFDDRALNIARPAPPCRLPSACRSRRAFSRRAPPSSSASPRRCSIRRSGAAAPPPPRPTSRRASARASPCARAKSRRSRTTATRASASRSTSASAAATRAPPISPTNRIRATVEKALAIARYTAEDPAAGLADPDRLARTLPDLDLYHPWDARRSSRRSSSAARRRPRRSPSTSASPTPKAPRVARGESEFVYANSHGFAGGYRTLAPSHRLLGRSARTTARCSATTGTRRRARRKTSQSAAEVGRIAGERTVRRLECAPARARSNAR